MAPQWLSHLRRGRRSWIKVHRVDGNFEKGDQQEIKRQLRLAPSS